MFVGKKGGGRAGMGRSYSFLKPFGHETYQEKMPYVIPLKVVSFVLLKIIF